MEQKYKKEKEKPPKSQVLQMVLKYAWKSRSAFLYMLLFMILGSVFSMLVPRITEIIINGLSADPIAITQGEI
ncbi:MAG: hypothetical protein ACTSWW_13430, partial [Promethearchaeota archaeon]